MIKTLLREERDFCHGIKPTLNRTCQYVNYLHQNTDFISTANYIKLHLFHLISQ